MLISPLADQLNEVHRLTRLMMADQGVDSPELLVSSRTRLRFDTSLDADMTKADDVRDERLRHTVGSRWTDRRIGVGLDRDRSPTNVSPYLPTIVEGMPCAQ